MHAAVMQASLDVDAVIMAAAVADYTPSDRAATKVAKSDGPLTLTLTRTRDILADLARATRWRSAASAGRFRRGNRRCGAEGARQAGSQAGRSDRGQRRVAIRSRLRRRDERGHDRRAGWRGDDSAAAQGSDCRRDPRSHGAAAERRRGSQLLYEAETTISIWPAPWPAATQRHRGSESRVLQLLGASVSTVISRREA